MATINHTVTVANYAGEGNRIKIDGVKHPNLFFARGNTYVFDVSNASVSGHPIKFSETLNGTHASGSEFTTGVTASGTAGSSSATVTIVVDGDTPDLLHIYCGSHSGMMGTTASIKISGVILTDHTVDDFTTNVSIFSNTIAREIPTKIESIATALKTHTNTELGDITTYVNASLGSILTELNEMAGNIAKEQVEYEAQFDTAFSALQTNLGTEYFSNPYKGYQTNTQADISTTKKNLGFDPKFSLELGIKTYIPEIIRLHGDDNS